MEKKRGLEQTINNIEKMALDEEYERPEPGLLDKYIKTQTELIDNTSGLDLNLLTMSKIPKKQHPLDLSRLKDDLAHLIPKIKSNLITPKRMNIK